MNKNLDCAFELKALSDSGTFSGYGSVWDVVDSYQETVAKGAFLDSLAAHKAAGRMPAMLWQHRSAEPIGIYTDMHEDDHGLAVEGQLALATVRGAEAHALMKMKALTGLSIGYSVPPGGDSYDKATGITTLKAIKLWEVSPVTFPALDSARIQGVKSIETIEDLVAAEKYLRNAGLSRSEAKAFIARLRILGQRHADEGAMDEVIELLKRAA